MGWWALLCDRLWGFEIAGRWRLYPADEADRRKHGLPARIPVPREVWRTWRKGSELERLPHAELADYAGRFARERPAHRLAAELALFARKAPLAARVEAALRDQQWPEAERLLAEVLELDPGDGRAWLMRGLSLQGLGRLEEAERAYQQAEARSGETADLLALRAGLLELRGRGEEARASCRRALELEPGHPLALERLASLGELVEIYLGDLDKPEKAYLPRAEYERVIAEGWDQAPQTLAFYLERSEFHLRRGQASLALQAAERAGAILRQEPADERLVRSGRASAAAARCRALIALERYDEAEGAVGELRALAPEAEATLSCLGQLLWFRGERARGAAVLMRAIEANPNRIENLQLYLSGEFPRAERDPLRALDQLLAGNPGAPNLQALAASLHLAAGGWERGTDLAVRSAAGGADEQLLLELSGRLGRAGRHADVGRIVDSAGGWERFLGADPMLRSNVAASLRELGRREAATGLWDSVVADARAHPAVRLRARALRQSLERDG